MYAVVKSGGKQLRVELGTVADVELLDVEPGSTVTLVPLLVSDEGDVKTKAKDLEALTVTAEVVEHVKADKVLVFKFKKRKGYKKLRGHRQQLTRIKVTGIGAVSEKTAAATKKAAAAPAAKAAEKKAPAAKAAAVKKTVAAPAAKVSAAKTAETKAPAAKAAATKATATKAAPAKEATKAPDSKAAAAGKTEAKPAAKKPAAPKRPPATKKPVAKPAPDTAAE